MKLADSAGVFPVRVGRNCHFPNVLWEFSYPGGGGVEVDTTFAARHDIETKRVGSGFNSTDGVRLVGYPTDLNENAAGGLQFAAKHRVHSPGSITRPRTRSEEHTSELQ